VPARYQYDGRAQINAFVSINPTSNIVESGIYCAGAMMAATSFGKPAVF
jgi:hypothetical protein